jgi:hypothetical protein
MTIDMDGESSEEIAKLIHGIAIYVQSSEVAPQISCPPKICMSSEVLCGEMICPMTRMPARNESQG